MSERPSSLPVHLTEEAKEYIRANGNTVTIGYHIQESGCA